MTKYILVTQNRLKRLMKWSYIFGKQDGPKFSFDEAMHAKIKALGFAEVIPYDQANNIPRHK